MNAEPIIWPECVPNWTLSTAASGAEERWRGQGQGQGLQCGLITGASMTGLQLIAQSSPCCCRLLLLLLLLLVVAAAGLILINFERLTRRHKHALKKIISHAARSSQRQLPLGSCKSQVASCKLAVCGRMGQPHLKHCQSVTISISYSYLVSRTSRRSPVAQLFAADTAHTAPGRQDGGQTGEEDAIWERGRGGGTIIRQRGKVDYDDGL